MGLPARKRALTSPPAPPVAVPLVERLRLLRKAVRVHQWSKNALVFLPMLLAHRIFHPGSWLAGVIAFFAFSFCASSVYLFNDLMDLESDRRHPEKRHRPFASGKLPVALARWLIPLLIAAAFTAGLALLPFRFSLLLGLYLAMTTFYSLALNREPIVDILVLAGFYTLRILAGGAATESGVSPWLLGFSTFFFVSLAFLKRCVELERLRGVRGVAKNRAGYEYSDLQMLMPAGLACGYLSVLVLALYINSATVVREYRHPNVLWGICPLLLYWVSRVWFAAHRGRISTDPVVYALRDRVSLMLVAATGAVLFLAAV